MGRYPWSKYECRFSGELGLWWIRTRRSKFTGELGMTWWVRTFLIHQWIRTRKVKVESFAESSNGRTFWWKFSNENKWGIVVCCLDDLWWALRRKLLLKRKRQAWKDIERYMRNKEYPSEIKNWGKKSNFRRACKNFFIANLEVQTSCHSREGTPDGNDLGYSSRGWREWSIKSHVFKPWQKFHLGKVVVLFVWYFIFKDVAHCTRTVNGNDANWSWSMQLSRSRWIPPFSCLHRLFFKMVRGEAY